MLKKPLLFLSNGIFALEILFKIGRSKLVVNFSKPSLVLYKKMLRIISKTSIKKQALLKNKQIWKQ